MESAVRAALSQVIDPEIRKPITELGMVDSIAITGTEVDVHILLTIPGCPLAATIEQDVQQAVAALDGVDTVNVTLGAMNDEQRAAVREKLQGDRPADNPIPFAQEGNTTRVILVSSGKGGVGKSSLTVNLALAIAERGQRVGILDADIYGHSVINLLGLYEAEPTAVDGMILPIPYMGMSVISIGMFKSSRDQVIAWRGPMLDRALQQFLGDVFWGDLDVLLIDLPPGTGDVALSLGHKLPNAEVLVVTTPQSGAAEVAERAGVMAAMLEQKLIGVVENMSYLPYVCPNCGAEHRVDVFAAGGGAEVAAALTQRVGYEVPLLAELPIDPQLSVSADRGIPYLALNPESPVAAALKTLAERL
jgi:ATP-binding protein involved in chromosome partitioning